jgi:hypothetical protein
MRRKRERYITAALLALCLMGLSSCGYRWGNCAWTSERATVCIPYVEGDRLGHLTSELTRRLLASGYFCYEGCEADYALQVCITEIRERNIGYRYDKEGERGTYRRRVVPSESRLIVYSEVTLIDCHSGCEVLGPTLVEAAVDYDFDVYANHSGDNIFSLGQINDRDISRDLVELPLFRELAKNIVDYIVNTW